MSFYFTKIIKLNMINISITFTSSNSTTRLVLDLVIPNFYLVVTDSDYA